MVGCYCAAPKSLGSKFSMKNKRNKTILRTICKGTLIQWAKSFDFKIIFNILL
jgi:hypothetical protein